MACTCEKCGAVFIGDETCDDRFNMLQAKELEVPEYFVVHHLSVPCFMLQHNRYSRTGWIDAYHLLAQFIQDGLKLEAARQMLQNSFNSKRDSSITKGEKLLGVEDVKWRVTIADVKHNTAQEYCDSITTWAKAIIEDAAALEGTGYFSEAELRETRRAILSLQSKSEKASSKLNADTWQYRMMTDNVKACGIALALIDGTSAVAIEHTTLNEAFAVLSDALRRAEAVIGKFAEGTSQHTLQRNRIAALKVALTLIKKEMAGL
ncbi:MAG: DUF5946 family protein [Christensenellaceae bacterium]|jgi:hypothetical protein|nr:DUF5946 family protein [Christensenellaceae bacterium]